MAWQHAPIALIPVVMFAGCGGGSSAHQSANTPGGTTAASTQQARAPQTAAQIAQERAIGSRALLRLSDFPTGWTAGEREGGSSQAAQLRREVAACLHVPVSQLDENDPAEVKSPKFKGPESEEIGNTVVVRPTAEAAVSYFSVFDAAQTPACLTSATRTVFARKLKEAGKVPAAVEVGSPTVERMSFPSFGDQSIAYRISVPCPPRASARPSRSTPWLFASGGQLPRSPSSVLAHRSAPRLRSRSRT
jgi:hypothetical protein